jgi:hypothetical protein
MPFPRFTCGRALRRLRAVNSDSIKPRVGENALHHHGKGRILGVLRLYVAPMSLRAAQDDSRVGTSGTHTFLLVLANGGASKLEKKSPGAGFRRLFAWVAALYPGFDLLAD